VSMLLFSFSKKFVAFYLHLVIAVLAFLCIFFLHNWISTFLSAGLRAATLAHKLKTSHFYFDLILTVWPPPVVAIQRM